MKVNYENYRQVIGSYLLNDWKPLVDLMPKIEKVEKYGDDTEATKLLERGIILFG